MSFNSDDFNYDVEESDRRHSRGRRSTDNLELIDTSTKLTLEELIELKKLAHMSKTAKIIFGAIIGAIAVLGVPTILDWINKCFK